MIDTTKVPPLLPWRTWRLAEAVTAIEPARSPDEKGSLIRHGTFRLGRGHGARIAL